MAGAVSARAKEKARAEGELMFLLAMAQEKVKHADAELAEAEKALFAGAYARVCEQIDEAISQLKDAREASQRLRFREANEGSPVALVPEPCSAPFPCACELCVTRPAPTPVYR